ncbi:MAG TPA: hypothetical protein VFG42_08120 [Baekduia sp.]|uniref:hypothetical protein n=1 Tax=Baekduia sp. TaxID=2600305 RepID=UPI002D792F48|nr:hypothetical protein [Baekduia sp.]HET6506741.1 hypothetical protein [Baekduia sp.]
MSAGDSGRGKTLAMGIDNTGFIVDRIGRDCGPLQYIREFTQNSIEAISDTPGRRGTIIWDADWNTYDLTGNWKLCIVDTGIGMDGDEQIRFINQLSSSGHEQDHDKNFGVGAKVAGATRNHAGLIYLSWKDGGEGHMTHLWRDPTTKQYGIARVERPDGSFADYATLTNDVKPDMVKTHGTKVVLLGMTQDANTMEPPLGVEGRQRWIVKYLNTRYFRFPKGIDVKVREGYQAPRDDTRRNFLRNVSGMEKFLDDECAWRGSVDLTGATAHVWILTERAERSKQGDMFATTGHVAALYQDELYELTTGRAGVARLQQFGVIFGHQRVVIYVEPDVHDQLGSNTARTQLLVNGEPLPWTEWAAEFRTGMPSEVKELMDEITSGTVSNDHKQAIRDRLKQIRELLRHPSRYRRTPSGALAVSGDVPGGRARERDIESESNGGGGGAGGRGGRAGSVYAMFVVEDGDPGEETQPDPMPDVMWISERHTPPTRTADLLEDRAAKYLADQNLLQINADFRVFTDMIDRWSSAYGNTAAVRTTVEEVVHEWFEQGLVETVIGAQALQGSREWTMEDIGRLWSEEALTAAVLQRYHVDINVKRTLGAKLGSVRDVKPAA